MSLQKHQEPLLFAQHGTAERRFLQLISALPKVSVQGYDKQRNVIYWNKSSEDMYGYNESEALGQKLEDLIIPSFMRDDDIEFHQRWIDFGEPIPSNELVLKKKRWSTYSCFFIARNVKAGYGLTRNVLCRY